MKCFKTLLHVSILSDHHQGVLFLAKVILRYSQFNSYMQTRCCGSISCCVLEHWLGVRRIRQHIPTQHDLLPQQLFCKYELNCEYCNISLARNKAPCWWSDKIETSRIVLKCFKVFYVKLYVHSLVDKLKYPYLLYCMGVKHDHSHWRSNVSWIVL